MASDPYVIQRPYFPRRYAQPQTVGDFERGWKIGQGIGGGIGDLAAAIKNQQKDKIANQLMGEAAMKQMPAAQDLGTLPADTGQDQPMDLSGYGGAGPNVGQLAPTGGVLEWEMRQKAAKQAQDAAKADLESRYKTAQIAQTYARTGEAGARTRQIQAGKPQTTKTQKYVAGTSDVQNDPTSDDFNKLQADFEAQHGKGSYAAFVHNMGNLKQIGDNLVVEDPDNPGKPLMKNGVPVYSIKAADAPYWISRYEATRIRSGQGRLTPLTGGINPGSGQNPGTQVNPVQWDGKDNLYLRSLPDGTYVQLPDGSVKPIRRTGQQQSSSQATVAQPSAPSADDQLAEEDTEDTNAT